MLKYLLIFPLALCATIHYESPWLGNTYEFEWQIEGGYGFYHSINASEGPIAYHDNQILTDTTLAFSLIDWQFLLGASAAKTAKESYNLTDGTLLVRYNVMNDVADYDPFSFTLGLQADLPLRGAISDPGLLYSSYFLGELQASVGKEWPCGPFWDVHLWGLFAFGTGTQYSPWFRGKAGLEKNFEDIHQLGLFIEGRKGFGNSPFPGLEAFNSYGPISYSFWDASARYAYHICYFGTVAVDYTLRLASQECPANRQAILVSLNIPFSV